MNDGIVPCLGASVFPCEFVGVNLPEYQIVRKKPLFDSLRKRKRTSRIDDQENSSRSKFQYSVGPKSHYCGKVKEHPTQSDLSFPCFVVTHTPAPTSTPAQGTKKRLSFFILRWLLPSSLTSVEPPLRRLIEVKYMKVVKNLGWFDIEKKRKKPLWFFS